MGSAERMDIFGVCVLGVVTLQWAEELQGYYPESCRQECFRIRCIPLCGNNDVLYCIYSDVLEAENFWAGEPAGLYSGDTGDGYSWPGLEVCLLSWGLIKGFPRVYGRTFFFISWDCHRVGGGLVRDMMAGVPPYIFVHSCYACASIVEADCLCLNTGCGRSAGQ